MVLALAIKKEAELFIKRDIASSFPCFVETYVYNSILKSTAIAMRSFIVIVWELMYIRRTTVSDMIQLIQLISIIALIYEKSKIQLTFLFSSKYLGNGTS